MRDFRAFERQMMLALYRAWQNGNPLVSIAKALVEMDADAEWESGWLVRVHDSLRSKGYLEGPANRRVEEMTLGSLTASGLQYVEDHFPNEELYPDEIGSDAERGESAAPAADRLVRFDHNSATFQEIALGIGDLAEAVRTSNTAEIQPEERDRVVRSLQAASTFWDATQLKFIQLKVGVLMAVEDAAHILKSTTNAVAAALLVDTIKAFVKTHTGFDVDSL